MVLHQVGLPVSCTLTHLQTIIRTPRLKVTNPELATNHLLTNYIYPERCWKCWNLNSCNCLAWYRNQITFKHCFNNFANVTKIHQLVYKNESFKNIDSRKSDHTNSASVRNSTYSRVIQSENSLHSISLQHIFLGLIPQLNTKCGPYSINVWTVYMDLQLQPSKTQSFLLKGNVALTTESPIQSMSAATYQIFKISSDFKSEFC